MNKNTVNFYMRNRNKRKKYKSPVILWGSVWKKKDDKQNKANNKNKSNSQRVMEE